MTPTQQKLAQTAAISTVIFLSACGGGSSSNEKTPIDTTPEPFQSSFTSSLKIIENKGLLLHEMQYSIKDKTTNEKDDTPAYSVVTALENTLISSDTKNRITHYPLLNQFIKFDLQQDSSPFTLSIRYDPIRKQANSFTLSKNDADDTNFEQLYSCMNEVMEKICNNVTFHYDEVAGTADISFDQTKLQSTSGSIYLDGQLKGTLSIPPRTVQDIPQTSHGTVTVEGKTHQVLAAFNQPEQIIGANISDAGIAVLLDNAGNLSFKKNDQELYGQYRDSSIGLLNAHPSTTSTLSFKKLGSTSQFILQPTVFNFSYLDLILPRSITISATIDALNPQQELSISPLPSASPAADQTNAWYATDSVLNHSSTPSDFAIHLINHNTVIIESQDITATLKDKQLESIQLKRFIFDFAGTSSITSLRVTEIDYQCGKITTACQGVTVEPNGFGVKFNNTVLTNASSVDNGNSDPLPPSIKLNGGLVYQGR